MTDIKVGNLYRWKNRTGGVHPDSEVLVGYVSEHSVVYAYKGSFWGTEGIKEGWMSVKDFKNSYEEYTPPKERYVVVVSNYTQWNFDGTFTFVLQGEVFPDIKSANEAYQRVSEKYPGAYKNAKIEIIKLPNPETEV